MAPRGYSPFVTAEDNNEAGGPDPKELNAKMAGVKAASSLMLLEVNGCCGLERDSVYGAAVALPQVARSAGWPRPLLALTVRVYTFLAVNFLLQGFLVCVINEEALVMNPYGGKMHLCDFGASMEQCPGGPGCVGPGGTEVAAGRLYSWQAWSLRNFYRDSMMELFPDRAQEIYERVDPGEYGVENPYCRLVCCFIFMIAVVDDLDASVELGILLLFVPTERGYWISYEEPSWATKDVAKSVHGWSELELVKFQIAGIPLPWKVASALFVLVPKLVLWYSVTSASFCWIMETAGILDSVINSLATTFVLGIDEMIIERFATVCTKHIMQNLQSYPLYDAEGDNDETPEEAYRRLQGEEDLGGRLPRDLSFYALIFPKKLFLVVIFMAIFTYKYYYSHCYRSQDGTWVSKDMHLPSNVRWDPLSLFFNTFASQSAPYWSLTQLLQGT